MNKINKKGLKLTKTYLKDIFLDMRYRTIKRNINK